MSGSNLSSFSDEFRGIVAALERGGQLTKKQVGFLGMKPPPKRAEFVFLRQGSEIERYENLPGKKSFLLQALSNKEPLETLQVILGYYSVNSGSCVDAFRNLKNEDVFNAICAYEPTQRQAVFDYIASRYSIFEKGVWFAAIGSKKVEALAQILRFYILDEAGPITEIHLKSYRPDRSLMEQVASLGDEACIDYLLSRGLSFTQARPSFADIGYKYEHRRDSYWSVSPDLGHANFAENLYPSVLIGMVSMSSVEVAVWTDQLTTLVCLAKLGLRFNDPIYERAINSPDNVFLRLLQVLDPVLRVPGAAALPEEDPFRQFARFLLLELSHPITAEQLVDPKVQNLLQKIGIAVDRTWVPVQVAGHRYFCHKDSCRAGGHSRLELLDLYKKLWGKHAGRPDSSVSPLESFLGQKRVCQTLDGSKKGVHQPFGRDIVFFIGDQALSIAEIKGIAGELKAWRKTLGLVIRDQVGVDFDASVFKAMLGLAKKELGAYFSQLLSEPLYRGYRDVQSGSLSVNGPLINQAVAYHKPASLKALIKLGAKATAPWAFYNSDLRNKAAQCRSLLLAALLSFEGTYENDPKRLSLEVLSILFKQLSLPLRAAQLQVQTVYKPDLTSSRGYVAETRGSWAFVLEKVGPEDPEFKLEHFKAVAPGVLCHKDSVRYQESLASRTGPGAAGSATTVRDCSSIRPLDHPVCGAGAAASPPSNQPRDH